MKIMEYHKLSLEEIISKIKSGETTSEEVFSYFIERTKKFDSEIKSYNYLNEEGAVNNKDSILAWAPIAVKDIFSEKDLPTTCASNMLAEYIAPFDATTISKLKEAGFASLWKVNMDEFAMGSTSETSKANVTLNPWGVNRIPGGSSWGSAAAVAAWLAPASLWTDTGGSIRQPASMCGVVGFKPSYGRNSRFWVVSMASSLDTPWTLTKTVKDAGLLYDIMNWEDKKDTATISGKHTLDSSIWDAKDLKGMKLWMPKEFFAEGLDEGVRKTINEAVEKLKELWAEIVEVSLPMSKYALAAYYILMPAEVSTNLSKFDGIRFGHNSTKEREGLDDMYNNNRWEGFGDEVQRRILLGSYVLSAWFYDAYYKKASEVRTLIIKDFEEVFNKVDAIISPVSPSVAWKTWEKMDDPVKMYLSDMYTIPSSLAGLPGISVPCGFAESEDEEKEMMPVGLQINSKFMDEETTLKIGHIFETNTDWARMSPEKYN